MWKEEYRIGVESIDKQHMELFKMTEDLHEAIKVKADSERFRKTIEFLKFYVVKHFSEEEAYQESVNYSGLESHKQMHRKFTQTVLDYEKKLESSDYDIRVVKDLAGTLTAWLIYHVTGADQQIVTGECRTKNLDQKTYIDLFSESVQEVLAKMACLDAAVIKAEPVSSIDVDEDIFVKVNVYGDREGSAVFAYSYELGSGLLHSMTFIKPEQVDELMCSALAELTNIACGKALIALSETGVNCRINPPRVSMKLDETVIAECVAIQTGIGNVEMGVKIG